MVMVVVWQLGDGSERVKVAEGVVRRSCCVELELARGQGG
jgi:hypothetical protein